MSTHEAVDIATLFPPWVPNPDCAYCSGFDPEGRWHYHCGHCGSGPTSMLGHWSRLAIVDGKLTTLPEHRWTCDP